MRTILGLGACLDLMRPSILPTLSVLFAVLVACAEPTGDHSSVADVSDESDLTGAETGDGHSGLDTDTTGNATVGCTILPALTDLNARYFELSCVFGGCHDESAAGGLNLGPPGLHARLVGVAAHNQAAAARGKVLVVPGAPDISFLVQKLEGTQARDEGSIQPAGAVEPIDPDCRIRALRQWISHGALDN